MQIHLMHPGQPVTDFAIAGTVVTVAGLEIDCATRQQDVANIVEIRNHNGTTTEGDQGDYLAQIQIPARRYTVTSVETDADADTNDSNAPDATEVKEALPLDTNAVLITLWPTV